MYTLPELPFAVSALEPYIDARTMEIHHDKHHAAYVSRLNGALEKHPRLMDTPLELLLANIASLPADIRDDVRNHGGGHYNHSLFWTILGGTMGGEPAGDIGDVIARTFGSTDDFRRQFEAAATQRFGSGWAWLSLNAFGDPVIHSTANQDSPLMEGLTPVMGLDVWEHAYYLLYQNRRPDYLAAFWHVVNWEAVNRRYLKAIEDMGACYSVPRLRKVS